MPVTKFSPNAVQPLTEFSQMAQRLRRYSLVLWDTQISGVATYPLERKGIAFSKEFTGWLTLFINPSDLTREQPARVTVTQTPAGAWVDSFGAGLPRWTLRGTTGWRAQFWDEGQPDGRGHILMDGYLAYHAMEELFRTYYEENRKRVRAAISTLKRSMLLELYWIDHWDDEMWVVEPDGFPVKRRSAARNMLIDYEVHLTGLADLKTRKDSKTDPLAFALADGEARLPALRTVLEEQDKQIEKDLTALSKMTLEARAKQWLSDFKKNWAEWKKEHIGWLVKVIAFTKDFRQGLAGGIEVVKNAVAVMRLAMQTMTELPTDIMNMLNDIGRAMRSIRTSLRTMLCAVQSLAAYPYLFTSQARDIAADLLNLFKASGCATTMPRIKDLSWRASQQRGISGLRTQGLGS